MDQLVVLRKKQAKGEDACPSGVDQITLGKVEYDMLTVPFLYKLGDTLASYIESNTDEFNNLRPFEFEDSSEEEEDESEVGDLVGIVD